MLFGGVAEGRPLEVHDDGSGDWPVLIYGDSWARFRRLDKGVRDALAHLNPRIVSCGRSGRSAAELLADWPTAGLPDLDYQLAVLMVGVNDVVRHVGARQYATSTLALARAMPAGRVMVVEAPRVTGDSAKLPGLIKHQVYKLLLEDGSDTVTTYRAALHGVEILPVDGFPMVFKDGVHLTDECYVGFGAYLGERIRERLG